MEIKYCKGSTEEIEAKLQAEIAKDYEFDHDVMREALRQSVINHRYIIFDFECDIHTNKHIPNHCEVEILNIADSHDYEESLSQSKTFAGYDCEKALCEWLFTEGNKNATIIAHNGSG